VAGTIKKLAARIYTIEANGNRKLRLELGLDAAGKLASSGTPGSQRFDYLQLFDGSESKLRFSARALGGEFEHFTGFPETLIFRVARPFPLVRFDEIPVSGEGQEEFFGGYEFSADVSELFARDGSLNIKLSLSVASYAGSNPPNTNGGFEDLFSLSQLANPSKPDSFEIRLFGTNAKPAIERLNFPILAQSLKDLKGVVFKDHAKLDANDEFPDPRAIGLRLEGVRRRDRDSKERDHLGLLASVAVGATDPKKPGSAKLVLDSDSRQLDAVIEVAKDLSFDLVQDTIWQRDTVSLDGKADAALFSYLRVRPLPPAAFAAVWNERVARPYLAALRTVDDARDLSFVPVLENAQPLKDAEFEALFDVVQQTSRRNADDPVLLSIRPLAAQAEFAADAEFPGLITHEGKPVRRRVKVTIKRDRLDETFEWFDVPPPAANLRPEIIVKIDADDTPSIEPAGGLVRVGALDLGVPAASSAGTGKISIEYRVTFGSADPTRSSSSSAERDPKGRPGRARLPRHGEAVPRVAVRIDQFDLRDVLPGSQDPVPDAGLAFDAVLGDLVRVTSITDDPKVQREIKIQSDLRRDPPVVILDRPDALAPGRTVAPKETPFFLQGEEVTANDKNRRLSLTLHRHLRASEKESKEQNPPYRTIVIDPEPMTVALVGVPAFELQSEDVQENDGEIANWQTSELEGTRWEIARITEGFDLFFPPQATGEAAEKGDPWPTISPKGAETTVDYRLGTTARLHLRSSYFKQRYAEAPWNLRRVLGFAGQRAPGAGLDTARFEFLYGLAGRFTAPALRLAELGSRIGGVRDPLPARPRGIKRSIVDTESPQPLVEAELYDHFRGVSASFTKTWSTRVALFESYREGGDGPLSLEDKVAFSLRVKGTDNPADLDAEPWNPNSKLPGLRGGATRGFESRNIFEEVIGTPDSTRGQILDPAFSALGGSGFVRAFFANGKTRIVSDTSFGRTHTYAVERIGRIACCWNVAKHVIVYERTVLPADQFSVRQAGQHFGRPVLRKVREYIDILEPERAYPETGTNLKKRALLEAALFRTRRIPVDSQWGHDVPDGWIVSLWREGEDPDIYPKPDIRLQCTAAHADAAATIAARSEKPYEFVFFTSTRKEDGDNPNLWPARRGIDYDDVPPPGPVGEPEMDPNNPDGRAADDIMRDPLLACGTFHIDTSGAAANLVATRTRADPIGAVLQTITISRSEPTGFSGGPAGQALALRQEFDRILGDARRMENVLDEALSVGRTALGNLLGVVGKSEDEIKAALDAEIDRLGEVKNLIHREAPKVRSAIATAAERAKDNFAGAKSAWTDATDQVQARLKAEIRGALQSRVTTLTSELDKVVLQIDEFLKDVTPDKAEILARRIEETLAPVRLTIFSAINSVGAGLARLDRGIKTVRGEIDAARDAVSRDAEELKGRIAGLAAQADFHPLVALYEQYHTKSLAALDAADKVVRRDLPREIKDKPLFAAASKTVTAFLGDVRAKLVEEHDKAIEAAANAGPKIEIAKDKITAAITAATALITSAASEMQELTKAGAELATKAEDALAAFRSKLQQRYDDAITQIYVFCRDAAPTIGDIKDKVEGELKNLRKHANDLLTSSLGQATDDTMAAIGGLLNEIGKTVGDKEKELETAITNAKYAADTSIGVLEQSLTKAVDLAIDKLKDRTGGLAAAIAKAATELKQGAEQIANGLRDRIPPGLADDIRVLEEGYKRLSNAPTFQNPSDTLALIRAAGSSPILPNLKFNRERIAYFFDDARDAVQSSPVVALVNRLGDDLKALGIRVPTSEFLERLIPKDLGKYDFGKLFPDLGGLKLDGLFKNIRLPSLNDRVKVTHGFDKASLTAWAKAEAKAPFPKRAEIFEFGPLKLSVLDASFDALADIAVGLDGTTRRTTKAEVVGDWELAFSGQPLATLERTRVFFENGKGLDVDIDPTRVRLDKAIKFLSDLIKSYSEPNSGIFLEMLEENGMPSGLAARLDLPMPPLSFGAFSITGLRFSSSFELVMLKGSGGKRGDFAIGTTLALGRKSEPFVLRVWILVGGGWLETRARYFPSSGKLSSAVSIGLTAGLGLDFAFGPCRGFVYVMVGAYVEFESSGGNNNFSIAVIFLVRGGIVILGRFNIGLYLLLELIYRNDGSVIGRGTIEVSFKICWCCEIKIRQGVTYHLAKGSKSAASANHLDQFA
jgi:hypothetical protein